MSKGIAEVTENPERIAVELDASVTLCKNRIVIGEAGLTKKGAERSALIILNQRISLGELFLAAWSAKTIRICADGGANRLYEFFEGYDVTLRQNYIPDYIIGDLDSLKPDVKSYYASKGATIICQNSQYSTDFTKCIRLLSLHYNSSTFRDAVMMKLPEVNHGIEIEDGIQDLYNDMLKKYTTDILPIEVLAINAIGGRFDQTIHSITQLYKLRSTDPYLKLVYLTDTDIILLIPGGGTLLSYDSEFRDSCIGNCGLLPIGVPTTILETRGLKWDVRNWDTSIVTGNVSSSNRLAGRKRCYLNAGDDFVLNLEIFPEKLACYIKQSTRKLDPPRI
ncbi:thiamine diphosphokinase KNAG_0B03980 [Huiozyma naganishii CBS 8797]|uniref:Thiamine pyrophosphokinase n=1 Tax=Huiozyma naganishii (strain ATCC MYA-139 / BCRC 22969 / CBS 8797 / KCTC 17520 / NBRC 10181 / NCYC 3082 / Yp74L-3) TaxID=1071383 RepID=J7RH23_HUIN7|nr:hypothetical protein KNAG_0B03980 [Kazachstania naganishii CBS 8797]CCK68838.1 hypothetical protein KNAG_0B03980 [Kazachstania naganishii CBS 8797]